jgi:hypothetical protein
MPSSPCYKENEVKRVEKCSVLWLESSNSLNYYNYHYYLLFINLKSSEKSLKRIFKALGYNLDVYNGERAWAI